MAGEAEKTLWGIHGGKTGDADSLFLKHNVIAIGWSEMGNMSTLAADRELYETGSAMSFFQVENYADEFLAALGMATERTVALLKDRRAALIAAAVIGRIDVRTPAVRNGLLTYLKEGR